MQLLAIQICLNPWLCFYYLGSILLYPFQSIINEIPKALLVFAATMLPNSLFESTLASWKLRGSKSEEYVSSVYINSFSGEISAKLVVQLVFYHMPSQCGTFWGSWVFLQFYRFATFEKLQACPINAHSIQTWVLTLSNKSMYECINI